MRQEAIRRLSGACFVLGGFCIALATYTGGLVEPEPGTTIVPAVLAVFSGTFVLTFPWTRYDPRWFLLACPAANALVVWGSLLSGDARSPVSAFFYLVVSLTSAYRGGALLAAQVLLTAAASWLVDLLGGSPGEPVGPLLAVGVVRLAVLSAIALGVRAAIPPYEVPDRV